MVRLGNDLVVALSGEIVINADLKSCLGSTDDICLEF